MIRGRTSPSFIIALAVVLLLGGGYVAWKMLSPGAQGRSDAVVRDFVDAVGNDMAAYRRKIGAAVALERPSAGGTAAAVASIEAAAVEAMAKIEAHADAARGRLEGLENLSVRTLQNRLARIDKRVDEAKSFVDELAASSKRRLSEAGAADVPERKS